MEFNTMTIIMIHNIKLLNINHINITLKIKLLRDKQTHVKYSQNMYAQQVSRWPIFF
jgi:hypothetical protein